MRFLDSLPKGVKFEAKPAKTFDYAFETNAIY